LHPLRKGGDDANPPNIMPAQQQDSHQQWADSLHWLLSRGIDDIVRMLDPFLGWKPRLCDHAYMRDVASSN
jgi:hypothetical protein